MLSPWKESYDQPRQRIKKQRHYLANKGPSSQGFVFFSSHYGWESWTIKKAEHRRIYAFELWCWSSEKPRGDTPHPRSAAAAALRWSSHEEIPHVQGKRNPSKMVGTEKGHQRADRLKPQSQTTSQSDLTGHSLV